MFNLISFILNLPWTFILIFFALISIPRKISINKDPLALVFKIKSFWWFEWLPGSKGVRGMAMGNVVLLGPKEMEKDLEHELIHVEQSNRKPFIHFFLYHFETFRKGYRNNKYEVEAYEKAGNVYIE
jgi:hypothetical protein